MKKLRAQRGFSLTEMLVAVLILVVLTAAVTAVLASSIKVYQESTAYSEANLLCSSLASAITGELRFASAAVATNNATSLTFDSRRYGAGAELKVTSNQVYISVPNPDDPSKPAQYPLLPKQAYTVGTVMLSFTDTGPTSDTVTFTLKVARTGNTDVPLAETTVTCRLLNA